MTSKLTRQTKTVAESGTFPDFPPRDDMQNPLYLHLPGYMTTLRRHFGSPETTLVLSEVPLGNSPRQRRGILIPDLTVAFDVDVDAIIAQWGYAIEVQGKPPEFVLEVASTSTARNDEAGKREGYSGYGVPEYWRFDPTGGQRYRQGLAGDRLADGAYQPVTINTDGSRYWGHSEVLGLTLCWEEGQLRWWDPATLQYLATHDEEAEGRVAERDARIAAEDAQMEAEARVRELEDELARRRSEGAG